MGPFKITVLFELRADGGLRAYSDGVPGLALSSMDGNAALADITEMLSLILSERLNAQVPSGPSSSGCVSSHNARAEAVGLIPVLCHQAVSSPQRWTSRW
jgi:hypothetical protein